MSWKINKPCFNNTQKLFLLWEKDGCIIMRKS